MMCTFQQIKANWRPLLSKVGISNGSSRFGDTCMRKAQIKYSHYFRNEPYTYEVFYSASSWEVEKCTPCWANKLWNNYVMLANCSLLLLWQVINKSGIFFWLSTLFCRGLWSLSDDLGCLLRRNLILNAPQLLYVAEFVYFQLKHRDVLYNSNTSLYSRYFIGMLGQKRPLLRAIHMARHVQRFTYFPSHVS